MKQMIAACTRLCRPARRLCLLLLTGLLLVACREAEAFLQFAQVDPNGWTRGTGYVFTVDSLPTTQDYPLSVMLRKSSDKAYPFRSITLVVHQRWTLPVPDAAAQARADARRHFTAIGQPRPPRCMRDSLLMVRNDTLVADLSADDGELRAHGISLHPYTFPLATLRLPKGAKGRITVRHLMQRENITGIESVGLCLP